MWHLLNKSNDQVAERRSFFRRKKNEANAQREVGVRNAGSILMASSGSVLDLSEGPAVALSWVSMRYI